MFPNSLVLWKSHLLFFSQHLKKSILNVTTYILNLVPSDILKKSLKLTEVYLSTLY